MTQEKLTFLDLPTPKKWQGRRASWVLSLQANQKPSSSTFFVAWRQRGTDIFYGNP
jgi:hypothetical protein